MYVVFYISSFPAVVWNWLLGGGGGDQNSNDATENFIEIIFLIIPFEEKKTRSFPFPLLNTWESYSSSIGLFSKFSKYFAKEMVTMLIYYNTWSHAIMHLIRLKTNRKIFQNSMLLYVMHGKRHIIIYLKTLELVGHVGYLKNCVYFVYGVFNLSM